MKSVGLIKLPRWETFKTENEREKNWWSYTWNVLSSSSNKVKPSMLFLTQMESIWNWRPLVHNKSWNFWESRKTAIRKSEMTSKYLLRHTSMPFDMKIIEYGFCIQQRSRKNLPSTSPFIDGSRYLADNLIVEGENYVLSLSQQQNAFWVVFTLAFLHACRHARA